MKMSIFQALQNTTLFPVNILSNFLLDKESSETKILLLIPLAFLLTGFWGYAFQAVDFFSAIPGETIDARFNSVILEHVYNWVIGKNQKLWSPPFFFPFENILGFSDNHFGSVIFYIPLRLIGLSREIAFDGWFLIGFLLNFFSAFISLRILGFSVNASSVGAFIFTFSLPVLKLELHAQLTYRYGTPLAFAYFWKLVEERDVIYLVNAMCWITLQFFCGIYTGVFSCYLLFTTAIACFFFGKYQGFISDFKKSFLKHTKFLLVWKSSFAFFLFFSLCWMLYRYFSVKQEYNLSFPDWQLPMYLPQLADYFTPGTRLFFGFSVGLLFLLGAITSVVKKTFSNLGGITLVGMLILFVLTVSINGKSLYLLFTSFPGINSIRVVGRIVIIMTLPVGILSAAPIDRLLGVLKKNMTYLYYSIFIVIYSLLGIEVAAYAPLTTPIKVWRERHKAVSSMVPAPVPKDSILMVNKGDKKEIFFNTELDGMIVSQDLNIPTLNGYSAHFPPGHTIPDACTSPINRLLGYANFRKLPKDDVLKFSDNIIVVSPLPCDHEPEIGFFGTISREQASLIRMKVIDTKFMQGRIDATISITNNSQDKFRTISLSELPVHVSWRLVPISNTGQRLTEPSWGERLELGWSLEKGESRKMNISFPLPDTSKIYILEVSLVQEGFAWFHDLGMKIATSRITSKQN